MADKKEKKYLIDNLTLMAEWNWDKNNELGFDPKTLTPGSHQKAWWKCSKGHEWQASIDSRSKGSGCPYCSGRNAVQGENDLVTINPTLAKEWNYERNGELRPENFTANSGKKAWWKCGKGHEWQAIIANRNKGVGCPYCTGQKTLQGYNDLLTLNPELAKEWNHEKNGELKPEYFTANSGQKVWWKCNKGHEWQSTIANRSKGNGCPYCAGQKAIKGYNDLKTLNPTLATEWNYEKNSSLTPEEITPNSNKKVWWKCKKGHEWQSTIANRSKGNDCPICNSEKHTSLPEYAIIYYLRQYGIDVIQSYKKLGYELDVYIPSKKVAIEYDGSFYHKNKTKKDIEKNRKCKEDGIKLYRLREGLPVLNDTSIDYIVQEKQKNLTQVIQKILFEILGVNIDVDLQRDNIAIENLREYAEKINSLLYKNPILAKEWNYERNGKLKPENVTIGSEKKVWWKCNKGHEWQASIADRNRGRGCPYCSNRRILKGYNDLATTNPELAKEWNYEKNGTLTPEQVTANSGIKVWWKCEKGHAWQSSVYNRNNGSGCPYCSGRRVLIGYNDLSTVNPKLASEWNYEKNGNLKPENFMPNSNKKVWWKCDKGHEWQAIIKNRSKGNGCPYCSGRKKENK